MICCCQLAGTKACVGCPNKINEDILKKSLVEPFIGWDLIKKVQKAHKDAANSKLHFGDIINE